MYGGKGAGMLWTLAIIARLGIADYGLYGMGFALASILGPPLDNPWGVRAMRESDHRFVTERASRFLVGVAMMAGGAMLIPVNYIAWFGLFVAGGEIAFNSYKSQFVRDGHPDRVWRMDAIRQTTSIALACAYLFAVSDPTLLVASLLYCAPYPVLAVVAGLRARGHQPAMPGPPRLMVILIGEMLGTAVYLQGDVLLLGWLTNNTTVGYYTITWVLTSAIVAVGQSFGMTYHEPLRKSGGELSAGPTLRTTLALGGAAGSLVLIVGLALLLWPAPRELAVATLIMAGFCAMRTIISVFQVVLYAQRRDGIRFTAALALVPVKLGLVALLSVAGAVGAAIATTVTDGLLLLVFSLALYAKRFRKVP
jgi:hypothetical protein